MPPVLANLMEARALVLMLMSQVEATCREDLDVNELDSGADADEG